MVRRSIPKLFGEVAQKVIDNIKISNNLDVNFKFGCAVEIDEFIQKKSKEKNTKAFPLIALITDIDEDQTDFYVSARLNITICTNTRSEYTSEKRYAKTFEPILYPIYNELLKQLLYSGEFSVGLRIEQIEHEVKDLLKMGRTDGASLLYGGRIDGVEIRNLKINIKK